MTQIERTDYDGLVRLGAARLRALHEAEPFTSVQVAGLKEAARRYGRCGSLQTSDGLPCLAIPKTGWTVCRRHGANAPQTVQGAHKRIAIVLTPALEWLQEEWQRMQEPTCETCGYPSKSLKERRHYAAMLWRMLDRFGLGPGKTLTINTGSGLGAELNALVVEASFEEREELQGYLAQVRAWKDRVAARLGKKPDVVVQGEGVQGDRGNGDPGQGVDRGTGDAGDAQGLQRRDRDGEPG